MTMEFTHETLGQRVLFGTGQAAENVASELALLGATQAMVIAAPPERTLAEAVTASIVPALLWDEVVQHVPADVALRAREAAAENDIDVILSVGGGSTTGLAKAVALATGIPIVAVPTTYAGSEATNVWGLTEDRTKRTGVDGRVLPRTVVYDADLSKTLPVGLSIASGLNGLAHCIDSLWAPRTDPINQALALEGARALNVALRGIVVDPDDIAAREQALYGCYLAAVSFASAGSGLHHKICHVLGGTFDLPHAQTHATVLPYVLAFNAPSIPELAGRLAAALSHTARTDGKDSLNVSPDGRSGAYASSGPAMALEALRDLYAEIDAPLQLADYGFTLADIPEAAERIVAATPASNPVPVDVEDISTLLANALNGSIPAITAPVAL
ncbi:maleylacetate reductase [Paenarthrobacter nitroguajacolicus]|uniref:maleylacetate reductase n=1 Tax=Paenarthrobacter nitroguajacolicus TaxID=211146 RepID=UPI002857FCB8|nr:maleylacetate reductase [Paenarthrobacter nitroguajacolicus]MDR6637028.1 maleylacetate reductase [Paenarthrobacter nitroguajacolicus]